MRKRYAPTPPSMLFKCRLHYKEAPTPPGASGYALPIGAQPGYFDKVTGLGAEQHASAKRETLFNNTGATWFVPWARTITETDLSMRGAYALVGKPLWPRFERMEWSGNDVLTSFNWRVPLPTGGTEPVVMGISLGLGNSLRSVLSNRVAIVMYPKAILNNPGVAHLLDIDYRDNSALLKFWQFDISEASIPYPASTRYTNDIVARPATCQIYLETPDDWLLGEVFVTELSSTTAAAMRMYRSPWNWPNLENVLLNGGVYTAVAELVTMLRRRGYLPDPERPVPPEEPVDENAQAVVADDIKGEPRTWVLAERFRMPSGLDDLPDAPTGYEWAINVIGLVFLIEKSTGRFFAPHEVYNAQDRKGRKAVNAAERQLLLKLYRTQMDTLKGLGFTYKMFAEEIDDIDRKEKEEQ